LNQERYVSMQQKLLLLRRWWLKTRPCTIGIQVGDSGLPACREFYVPWYAWPLEALHRIVFGKTKLES
jgi:hypothetical protein